MDELTAVAHSSAAVSSTSPLMEIMHASNKADSCYMLSHTHLLLVDFLLLHFLHLNDSTKYILKGEPGYDPPYKLQPFVDPLIANFASAFTLGTGALCG